MEVDANYTWQILSHFRWHQSRATLPYCLFVCFFFFFCLFVCFNLTIQLQNGAERSCLTSGVSNPEPPSHVVDNIVISSILILEQRNRERRGEQHCPIFGWIKEVRLADMVVEAIAASLFGIPSKRSLAEFCRIWKVWFPGCTTTLVFRAIEL